MDARDFLDATRESYDRTAAGYAERFHGHLDGKPVDKALVSAFAGLVAAGGNKRVIDVGCGTGATTTMLASHGVDPFGVDLSPNMVAQARRLNPHLDFAVGSMLGLDASDDSVGGVCAWYSIIHVPDVHLAGAFAEFRRVLRPEGLLLLAFQVGDQPRILTEAFGKEVALTFARRQPQEVAHLLAENGFRVYAQVLRQPDDDELESTPQAYLIARRT